jgi:hypothetical protein
MLWALLRMEKVRKDSKSPMKDAMSATPQQNEEDERKIMRSMDVSNVQGETRQLPVETCSREQTWQGPVHHFTSWLLLSFLRSPPTVVHMRCNVWNRFHCLHKTSRCPHASALPKSSMLVLKYLVALQAFKDKNMYSSDCRRATGKTRRNMRLRSMSILLWLRSRDASQL